MLGTFNLFARAPPAIETHPISGTIQLHCEHTLRENRHSRAGGCLLVSILAAASASPATAEDLESAIKAAADYSPLLTSARSRLESCAADITIARAEGLPSIDGTVRYSKELGSNSGKADGFSADTSVNVPLFRGGAIRNGVKSSEAQCDASSASISEVESEVTLMLARAYAEVIASRRIVTLNREAVTNLGVMLDGVQQRLRARDLTRTDVDQAQSRLSLARGRLETALAALETSETEYHRLTGKRPGELGPFPGVFGIPLTADAAVDMALTENPGVIAARSEAQATRFSLNSAKGDLLPQVFATASSSYGETNQASVGPGRYAFGTTVGVGMRMSLYAGGRQNAKVRAASARVTQAEQQVINLERSVEARTRSAYAEWLASRSLVESSRQAVAANESALNGVRMENAVGTRTILEILNAEQELRDAQIQLANAERDHAVASIAILAALGRAKAGAIEFDHTALVPPLAKATSVPAMTLAASSQGASASVAKKEAPPAKFVTRPAATAPDEAASAASWPQKYTWAIQLGAFESIQAARSQWQIFRRFSGPAVSGPDEFTPGVYRFELNGRPLFRLAAISSRDWSRAQEVCLSIKAKGQTCLVKRVGQLGDLVWSASKAQAN